MLRTHGSIVLEGTTSPVFHTNRVKHAGIELGANTIQKPPPRIRRRLCGDMNRHCQMKIYTLYLDGALKFIEENFGFPGGSCGDSQPLGHPISSAAAHLHISFVQCIVYGIAILSNSHLQEVT